MDLKTLIPKDLDEKVDRKRVMHHVINLEKKGLTYTQSIAGNDVSNDEKLLITFYAFERALEMEHYVMRDQLGGLLIYGLLTNGYYDLAKLAVDKTLVPEEGGTISLGYTYLMNIIWLERKKHRFVNRDELAVVIPELKKYIKDKIDNDLERLVMTDRILRLREISLARRKLTTYVLEAILIGLSVLAASWIGSFLASHGITIIRF